MERKKILIIDDEEDVCVFSKLVLQRSGKFEVNFATSAEEGIRLAESYLPDLILLDIAMPKMDGADAAFALSKIPSLKNTPVVFLTALAKKDEVEEHKGVIGGHAFIAKPIFPQELINRVEAILDIKI